MNRLNYELMQLCKHNRDGSGVTQKDRLRQLNLIARQLEELGYRNMVAGSLKPRHISALIERWQQQNLSPGTLKNRMSILRWWAGKTGKPNLIAKDNKSLGIVNRQYVPEHSKARHITPEQLQQIEDPHLRASFQLQQAFGLRREECLKFQPIYADKGDHIELKGSWTKGGRPRTIPILNQHQREILDQAHRIAGNDSLIPNHKTYSQQRNYYDHQCRQLALHNMHGVRHMYAQRRYEELTGWKCPLTGGLKQKDLSARKKPGDRSARQIISHEMGHNRPGIVVQYIGR